MPSAPDFTREVVNGAWQASSECVTMIAHIPGLTFPLHAEVVMLFFARRAIRTGEAVTL